MQIAIHNVAFSNTFLHYINIGGKAMGNYLVSDVLHYCNVSLSKCAHMPPKKIDFYDLTFVLSGSMTYTADNETVVLKKMTPYS